METFLNPKTDKLFRRIFGTDKACAISFTGSLLPQLSPLSYIALLPRNIRPAASSFRQPTVRILCEDGNKQHRIVEIWIAQTETFRLGILSNIKRSKAALPLPLHVIYLADLRLNNSNDDGYLHRYSLTGNSLIQRHSGEDLTVIELPKFRISNPAEPTMAELWISFLTDIDNSVSEPPLHLLACPETKSALSLAKAGACSREEIDACRLLSREVERRRQCIAHAQKDMGVIRKLYNI
jgi:hypothetical protein